MNFIEDVKEWEQEDFLDEKIWTHLAQKIDEAIIPRSVEMTKLKKDSLIIPSKEGNLTSNILHLVQNSSSFCQTIFE